MLHQLCWPQAKDAATVSDFLLIRTVAAGVTPHSDHVGKRTGRERTNLTC
jgi:hypothetical protein